MTGLSNSSIRLPGRNVTWTVAGSTLALMLIGMNLGIVFNDTHSAPFGLYIEISASRDATRREAPYVFFCPDVRWPSMRGQPNYRSPMWTCPDGFSPLIKPVVAWPGDTVETSPAGLSVNGVFLANTVPLEHDSKGRLIHPFPYGTYRVSAGELWTVSSFSPRSFDSRYFGPIPHRSVRLWLRPLFVEKKYHSQAE